MAQPLTHTTGDTGDDVAAMDAVDALVDQLHEALDAEPRNAAGVAAALEAMVAACRRDPRIDDELDLASCLCAPIQVSERGSAHLAGASPWLG